MREFSLKAMESLLPETARELASVIGFEATQKLVERFGGARFPIGRGLMSHGEPRLALLRDTVGEENAQKMMQHFGGDSTLVIPRCATALREYRNRCFYSDVDALVNEGKSLSIALMLTAPRYGFGDSWAWHLLAERNKPDAPQVQQRLF
jgi:hypothetical protein